MSIKFGVILLAGLCVAACSSNSSPAPSPSPAPTPAPTPTPSGPTASVSIVNGAFGMTTTAYSPSPVTVAVGTTVTWTNNDITTHDARADNGGFSTPLVSPGGSASVKLSTSGSFVYHCSIHPGMVGTIVVQ